MISDLFENMRQYDSNNWCLKPEQFADLASSLNAFFSKTGVLTQSQSLSSAADSLNGPLLGEFIKTFIVKPFYQKDYHVCRAHKFE